MRQRKLQIFLSSTYGDLIDERLAAMEAILAAGHIPAAMEQFSPGDEEAWEKIKSWIDDSDCYLLILGGRYGSIKPDSGKSYTQLEYEYALEQNKPFMSIVMNEGVIDRKVREGRKHTDLTEQVEPQLYKDFKSLVLAKHCTFWSDIKDIKSEFYRKWPNWLLRNDLKGWIRAEESVSPEAMNELDRLSRENDELRRELSRSESFDGLSFEEMVNTLRKDRNVEAYKIHAGVPEKFEVLWKDYSKKYLVVPENAGHLFDICMNSLDDGISHKSHTVVTPFDRGMPYKHLGCLGQNIEGVDIEIEYDFRPLSRHNLLETQQEVFGHGSFRTVATTTTTTHKLSYLGKRFRNRLLMYGDQATRFRELWGVELADEEIVP